MRFATHISRLGTETAFAVSEDARAWAAKGHPVFPFHLGDLNIPTPPNIVEAAMQALRDGRTGYAPAAGLPDLRAAVAEDAARDRGVPYAMENVSIQPGGKPVIGKFLQALMNPGDEVLYPNPGYPIYESQIQFQGGVAVPYGYDATPDGFRLRRDEIAAAITPATRFLIYNNAQNPLGAESDEAEMAWIAELANRHDLWVLSDEAYFHIRYSGRSRSIVSLPGMAQRTIILVGHSKRFAMTGWRLGWLVGPRDDVRSLQRLFGNFFISTNEFVQWAGVTALREAGDDARRFRRVFDERRHVMVEGLRAVGLGVAREPTGAFYVLANARRYTGDSTSFVYEMLESAHVAVTPGAAFGANAEGYLRFSYAAALERIQEGLRRLGPFLAARG
jgi:aspartate/methionine/tyrosine aminotransferase